MRLTKRDLMIALVDEQDIRVFYRKRVWLIFYQWIEMTDQETENSAELPLIFKTIDEAIKFCDFLTN